MQNGDRQMRTMESVKRLLVLQLTTIGLLVQIAGYGFIWYRYYADAIKLEFWNRGNWLVIAIYAVLLFFFTTTYGGTKIGYLKPFDVFLSQVFATLMVNGITYAQISLMCERFEDTKPILLLTAGEIVVAIVWEIAEDSTN